MILSLSQNPPLCFSKENVDQVVETLRDVLIDWKE